MRIRRFIALALIGFFCLGTSVFSASMSTMDMHTPGAHSLCPMMGMTPACTGMLEHIASWQESFASAFVSLLTLAVLAIAFVSFVSPFAHAVGPPVIPRYVSLTPPLYQRLFSEGILNPKAP